MKFKTFLETTDQRVLVIMRGTPSAGKSTRAGQLGGGVILSTDDFFGHGDSYKMNFHPSKLPEAHEWNKTRVEQEMKKGSPLIIVDNTNINSWEAKPYIVLAKQYGYEPRIEEPRSEHWERVKQLQKQIQELSQELAARNKHGVPASTIARMISQYNNYSIEDAENSIAPWEK